MKLAIVVGHNSVSQGAVRKDTGESEFVWNGQLARRIERLAPKYDVTVRTFKRIAGGGYSREIRRVYDQVDGWGADASVELHFNSAASDAASGTETLTSGTPLSMQLATSINEEMCISLNLRDRGVKTRSSGDRGYKSLIAGKAPAALIEPFFGSSKKGLAATDEEHEQEALADAILRGACDALAKFPRQNLATSRTMESAQRQRVGTSVGVTASAAAAAVPIFEGLTGGAETALGAVSQAQRWSEFLPISMGALAVVGVLAFLYVRWHTDRIESARLDDYESRIQ